MQCNLKVVPDTRTKSYPCKTIRISELSTFNENLRLHLLFFRRRIQEINWERKTEQVIYL